MNAVSGKAGKSANLKRIEARRRELAGKAIVDCRMYRGRRSRDGMRIGPSHLANRALFDFESLQGCQCSNRPEFSPARRVAGAGDRAIFGAGVRHRAGHMRRPLLPL